MFSCRFLAYLNYYPLKSLLLVLTPIHINTVSMDKVTLAFPDDNSLWSFTSRSKATNLSVRPRSNYVSGIFGSEEIDMATNELNAVVVNSQSPRDSYPTAPREERKRPLRQVTRWLQSIDLRF
jgi:hypothetical protein